MLEDDPETFARDARVRRAFPIAAALAFAAFVIANGVPTLRHDWNWPVNRDAIASFIGQSIGGWLPISFGVANPHPTTYLIAFPIAAVMWLFGPLAGLALLAFSIGYCCSYVCTRVAAHWRSDPLATIGLGSFVLFNPWVYNEVVAGHLVMILAYGGFIGLFGEMACGANASPVRLALWVALIELQLQFFIIAMVAVFVFGLFTRKWLPLLTGILVALPSAIGLIADRGNLLQIPYSIEWQANQSVAPLSLLSLGGYFAGYADRLGLAAEIAAWTVLALALFGVVAARRSAVALWAAAAAVLIYSITAGVHGPFAGAYEWTVRRVPESGVFRELYDLAGIFAALVAFLAFAATARARASAYLALAAGIALPITWLLHPPSQLWIPGNSYPHVTVVAPPFSRVALVPAFQPMGLRNGGGDGADPDAFVYPGHVAALNEYLPTYPVDVALARYEQSGDDVGLRALGVAEIVDRPWLVSQSNGGIGLAASSLAAPAFRRSAPPTRHLADPAPLISQCEGSRIIAVVDRLGACDVFFGDAPGHALVEPVAAQSDSIDARTAWIDARLAFARMPALAQGIGGALTQSALPHRVDPGSWLLAYVRGRLSGSDGRNLEASRGTFSWISIPPNVTAVACAGLCELVAESHAFPEIPLDPIEPRTQALPFQELTPWLYRVRSSLLPARLVRLNERYDPGWVAISAWRVLPHVRVDLAVNGWFLGDRASNDVVLVHVIALVQLAAEILGLSCVLLLLKALVRAPTKRA